MLFDKAKKMLEDYNFDTRMMMEDGVYKEFDKYKVPEFICRKWYGEFFIKSIEEFKRKIENGEMCYKEIKFICSSPSRIDRNSLITLYNGIIKNVDKIKPIDEIEYYGEIISALSVVTIANNTGQENFEIIANGIKERLGLLLQNDQELQQKYQVVYDYCENMCNRRTR